MKTRLLLIAGLICLYSLSSREWTVDRHACRFGIYPFGGETSAIFTLIDKDNASVDAYKINGGVEFDVSLSEKPRSNTLRLHLDSSNLTFFYQPPLKNPKSDGSTWEDYGQSRLIRPANVNGSYAVYYLGHPPNIRGGKGYATGKAFHIYRPKIEDSSGQWTWGELNITGNTMTVTIPQSFLDVAVYPIHKAVGAQFGYYNGGTPGASSWESGANRGIAYNAGAAPSALTITKIATYSYITVGGGTPNYLNCIYLHDDDTGIPGARVDYTAQNTLTTTPSWRVLDPIVGATLTNGTTYWIGMYGNGAGMADKWGIKVDAGSVGQAHEDGSYSSPPPDPWDDNTTYNLILSAYVEYSSGTPAVKHLMSLLGAGK